MDALLSSRRPCGPWAALILFDLDGFGSLNDSLGPQVCDMALRLVAGRLRVVVPDAVSIARVSGDGFAILLSDSRASFETAHDVLELIRRPYAILGQTVNLSATFGIASADENVGGALGLLHAAGVALHLAQRERQVRVRRFEASMHETARRRQTLEVDLRAAVAMQQDELLLAISSHQFQVHYQPQVSLIDGRLTGFEALMRWRHPTRGLVSPGEFIPLAESIGVIDVLGDWVLRTACRDAARWPSPAHSPPLTVAVNVSPLQFNDPIALIDGIRDALRQSGLEASRLEIELTEQALAINIGDTLGAIRRLGVNLALDDFGSGHSSLGRLRRYPFTRIKIDRSLVSDQFLGTDEAARRVGTAMIQAIALLGASLDMPTVVEGIETVEQRLMARSAGCTHMQGYLVSRPVPAADVSRLIENFERECAGTDPLDAS
jgi:diguanylate cyclase (GGDEF)-like protein